ncbi:uncharacterized protein STEHIDRAFT_55784, partial [Stereum hirsutum FP-91666 SS1]|uniref:uncharacterized protein n=1 Tax=Stereum hirsutum (strain FP-91666) TaxID=721885 RepID=UPI000440C3E0
YLDEFSKSLAAEVRMLLGEVGKLREEKRALQHEMGWLLCMRSKYGPGGEFDPDWKPTGGPLAAQAEPAPPPEVPPPMPMEPPRTAWRNVTARTSRGRRRRAESNPPPEAVPTMDPRYHQAGGSWATWQRMSSPVFK